MGKKGYLAEFFYKGVYPGLAIIGTCTTIGFLSGEIQFTPTRNVNAQSSAQQALSKTSADTSIEGVVKRVMSQHPYYLEGYFLTPRAYTALDTIAVIEGFSTQQAGIIPPMIYNKQILEEAARAGDEDRFITESELEAGRVEIARQLKEMVDQNQRLFRR